MLTQSRSIAIKNPWVSHSPTRPVLRFCTSWPRIAMSSLRTTFRAD